jgi:[ribosomal protein S18]-alanine N-acetyltransferase
MAQRTNTGDKALPYSIRPMVNEDIEQVNEIDQEAFPTQWPPANYRQEMQNKIAHYLVADDDTRVFKYSVLPPKKQANKFLWLFPRRKPHHSAKTPLLTHFYIIGFAGIWMMADEAHITNLAVRQEYRGKGVGELLLLASIDLANELKASFMTLEVRASNLVAQSLYSKYSFAQKGVRKGYYLDNHEDAIIMSTDMLASTAFQKHVRQLREALKGKLD